jgi:hypothetical protein
MTFYKLLSKNKSIEASIGHIGQEWQWVNLSFIISRLRDHSGVQLELEVLGFYLEINFHDIRHWNYEANRWYNDGEEQGSL